MQWDNELIGPLRYDELRQELVRMGELGWELVSAYCNNIGLHFAALRRPNKIAVALPGAAPMQRLYETRDY